MKLSPSQSLRSFTFAYYMTVAVVAAYFPLYFDSLGFSKLEIGLISSTGPMVAIFSNLLWGVISDRLQTIKLTIIVLLSGQLLMLLLVYQASAFPVALAFMALFYFFQTPLNGLNDSQILLAIRENGKSYASFRVMGSIGYAFAAVSFGIFLRNQPSSRIALLALFTVALSLLLSLTLRDARRESGQPKLDFSGFRSVFLSRRLLVFLLLILVMSAANRSNDIFLSLYLQGLGAGKELIGVAVMMSACSEIPIFFLLSRYGSRYKELPLLGLASLGYAVRFGLMSFVVSPYAVIAVQALHGVTFGVFMFTALRYMQQAVPDRFRATGQAVYNMIWSGASGVIAGLVGGRLFDRFGGHTMYISSALLAFVAFAGFMLASLLQRDDAPSSDVA